MKQFTHSRKVVIAGFACALALSLCGMTACSTQTSETKTLDQRVTTAKASHSGRFETMGSHGCYGCHGATANAWPILTDAPKLPAFHFTVDSPTSFNDLGESYQNCSSCHIEITGIQKSADASES